MKTRVELSKEEIEQIVIIHLQGAMNLYSDNVAADTVWSSDGSAIMSVEFNDKKAKS